MRNISNMILAGGCLVMALCFGSCTEDSFPSLTYDEKDDVNAGNSESSDRVPVLLFTKDPFYVNVSGSTRSTGAYDQSEMYEASEWAKHKFYIYAFHKKAEDNPPMNNAPRYDVLAKDDEYGMDCLVDGSLSDPSIRAGLPVTINVIDKGVEGMQVPEKDDEGRTIYRPIYYSAKYQQTGYDFFMYRIDDDYDYNSHLHRDAGSGQVYYDLELDGAMDVMCGAAPQLTMDDVLNKLHYTSGSLTDAEYTDVMNILNYGYSTYSAHRGVHPVVSLAHCLTRLKFTAYAGAETANRLVIDAVKIKSKYKGKFVVASSGGEGLGLDLSVSDETKQLSLGTKDANGRMVPLSGFRVVYDSSISQWYDQEAKPMGESILLPPSGKYEMTIEFTEMRDYGNGVTRPFKGTATYTLQAPKDFQYDYFKEGYIYDIKVAIFGSEKIQVITSVQGWRQDENGGSIEIEPDFEE